MRKLYRIAWMPLYRWWALRYIRKKQAFQYAGIRLDVPTGVFHPGIFFSSPIFANYLQHVDLQGKKVLDVGTGSGFLALVAAQKGAQVTALDIHPLAVQTTTDNARANGFSRPEMRVIQSDLFEQLPPQAFDFILVNPPYYPKKAQNLAEHAFFAGENLNYFCRFFAQLAAYLHPETAQTRVWMIVSEDCAVEKIAQLAQKEGFSMSSIFEKKKWGERFFIFQIDQHPND